MADSKGTPTHRRSISHGSWRSGFEKIDMKMLNNTKKGEKL